MKMDYAFTLLLQSGSSLAQHDPHDFPHRMGGLPGMTDQTLQETARVIHEQHAHDRKVADPEQTFAFGRAGERDRVSRTVNLDVSDRLRIEPAHFTVKRRRNIAHSGEQLGHLEASTAYWQFELPP